MKNRSLKLYGLKTQKAYEVILYILYILYIPVNRLCFISVNQI